MPIRVPRTAIEPNPKDGFSESLIRLLGIGRHDPEEAKMLRARVADLIAREYQDPDCKRYVKRLKREINHLFTFLERDVDYHNNISERSVRVFAKARKVLYGSRTERGAHRTKILMSVYATCKARDMNFYEFLMDYLSGKVKAIPSGPPQAAKACAA